MNDTHTAKPGWINPLTVIFLLSLVVDVLYCVYWASIDATLSRGFADYLAISAYPFTVPGQSVLYFIQRLQDPYTGHGWQWEVFVCALLAVAMLTVLFASVASRNEKLRRISIRAGIPIVLLWLAGALLAIPLSGIS